MVFFCVFFCLFKVHLLYRFKFCFRPTGFLQGISSIALPPPHSPLKMTDFFPVTLFTSSEVISTLVKDGNIQLVKDGNRHLTAASVRDSFQSFQTSETVRAPNLLSFKGVPSPPSWCFKGYFHPLFINLEGITLYSKLPALYKPWVKTQNLILNVVFGFWL